MRRQYNISSLEGKVSEGVLSAYTTDYHNLQISSIIAGFHRTFGHRNEGIMMSLDIIDNIKDDTLSDKERNILIWNLYMLSSEFIDEGIYDRAVTLIKRAENNWNRDVVLGDEIGVYHVSWMEQLWQKYAEVFFLTGDKQNFSSMSEKIISSRMDFFNKAEEITGETILKDRCAYNCLNLMAFELKRHDLNKAVELIKEAIIIRRGIHPRTDNSNEIIMNANANTTPRTDELNKMYWSYVKYYYTLYEHPFDNVGYTYCRSCKQYEQGKCKLHNREVEFYKCCSKYRN